MTTSALLRHGPGHATVLLDGLSRLDGAQGIRRRSTQCAACSRCRRTPTRRRTSAPATSARCGQPTAARTDPGDRAQRLSSGKSSSRNSSGAHSLRASRGGALDAPRRAVRRGGSCPRSSWAASANSSRRTRLYGARRSRAKRRIASAVARVGSLAGRERHVGLGHARGAAGRARHDRRLGDRLVLHQHALELER